MKGLSRFCLVLLTIAATVALAGDIQVTCEPELRVFLDGKLVGTSSSKQDGLFLSNVPGGTHIVRVEKDGFAPQSFQVEVEKVPVEVKVTDFTPEPVTPHEGAAGTVKMTKATGNLLVTSAPQNCLVEIDGKAQVKATPLLRIDGLAPGDHRISFHKTGFDRVYGLVVVEPGVDVAVRGDLLTGKLETFAEGEGSLRVISKPMLCTVQFMGKTHDKTHEKLNISHLPAGAHRIVVSWNRRRLSTDVVITEGQRAVVIVSFISGDEPFVVTYEPE